ncbi:MAG: EamA family transporter [Rhodospirillales bacterium]
MVIDTHVVLLVLLAAMMHATWNALVRSGTDTLMSLFVVKAPTILVAAGVLMVTGLPEAESYPYLCMSAAINCGYFYFLIKAYSVGDLSVCYPIARGVAPMIVLLLSVSVLGETPPPSAYAGVAVISFGILVLAWRRDRSLPKPAGMAWALALGLTIAGYTLTDGIGARLSANPFGYTAVLNILTGILLCAAVVYLRGRTASFASLAQWKTGLGGGTLMFGAYALVIYALTLAPVASIAALRETGVIFAAIIGTLVLKEPLGIRRVIASVFVAAGVAILVVFR